MRDARGRSESETNRCVVVPPGSVFDIALEHRRALPATTWRLIIRSGFFARAAAVAKPRRRLWPATSSGSIPTALQRRFTTCATIRSPSGALRRLPCDVSPTNSGRQERLKCQVYVYAERGSFDASLRSVPVLREESLTGCDGSRRERALNAG